MATDTHAAVGAKRNPALSLTSKNSLIPVSHPPPGTKNNTTTTQPRGGDREELNKAEIGDERSRGDEHQREPSRAKAGARFY